MRIGFISCVKSKRNHKEQARNLYISDLFKKSLKYCLDNYDDVYILSAKYGLLELTDVIEPYEKTLNTMSKKDKFLWYNKTLKQIKDKTDLKDDFFFHCGVNYRNGLISDLPNKCYIPLKGISFGNQLKYYKNELNKNLKLF